MKLTVFEQNQLKVAKATLGLSDVFVKIMGGMTKEEAHKILEKYAEHELEKESEKI